MTATALVVDDEVDLCRLMQITLTKMGIKSDVAYSLSQAQSCWENNDYDFCLTDLQLPDGSGLELVKQINASSSTPVAVITAHGSMDLAIEALKLGAFDFVNKPLELPRLRQLVENALKVVRQADESEQKPNERTPEQQLLDARLIGDSVVMQKLKTTITKLARSQAPVFLSGASGTGKEVVARLIHDLSPRRDGSFVPVNCGAIPSELMESEFFGHKKGSFTGAVADKQGLFQQASGGTLFLDEVADLPLVMQVKLLRAIQEKTVRAIGDTKEVPVDIRILSATHKDLSQLVESGDFRQDLYYRINVIELKLPTLNERCEDIPVLAKHFLNLISEEWQLDTPAQLTQNACQRLKDHDFAGNVRELRNILERAVTLSETSVIDSDHLGLPAHQNQTGKDQAKSHMTTDTTTASAANKSVSPLPSTLKPNNNANSTSRSSFSTNLHPYRLHSHNYASTIQTSATDSNQVRTSSVYDQDRLSPEPLIKDPNSQPSLVSVSEANLPQRGLEAYLQDQEKNLIIKALKQTNWNKTQAAELLGTTFRSLRYRMKKLEIDEEQHDDS